VTQPLAASAFEIVLALHIMAVVVAFGVTFAYPIMFAVGAKASPRSLPVLHRVEYTTERWLVNPGLVVVLAAGIYLASESHQWSAFFVQWGFAAVIVIGAVVGAVMIPTAKKAEQAAERDISAAAEGEVSFGEEYQGLAHRLSLVGGTLSLLVLVTILLMVIKPG
jgi:Predicted integral membrane protein (DUF2269)